MGDVNPWISALIGAVIGGTFGLLVAALAAASARATWLEEHIYDGEEDTDAPGVFLLESREALDEDTLAEIASQLEAQTGGRVIILDAYQVDDDDL